MSPEPRTGEGVYVGYALAAKRHRHYLIALVAAGALVACADAEQSGGTAGSGGMGGAGGAAGAGGGGTFVCDSEFAFEFEPLNACASESCCASFGRCFPDTVCRACLDTPTPECETDALFMPLLDCVDTNCPASFCDSGISFNSVDDPLRCNACIDANYCTEVAACVGGEGTPNLNDCLFCLGDSESVECQSAAMSTRDGAEDVVTCIQGACSTDCAGSDL